MMVMGFLDFLSRSTGFHKNFVGASEELFHLFHPAHILFSAVATTAMFWRHDNHSLWKAVLIGFIGSVGICGVSDVFLPFIGGRIFDFHMHFHVCLIEEPGLVYPFALIGVASGLMVTRAFEKSTQYSHGVHVFLSSMASLLYLISFGVTEWMHSLPQVCLITLTAVMLPCCLSDIVFPLMCSHRYCHHTKEG